MEPAPGTYAAGPRERRDAIDLMVRAAAALSQRGQRMAINMWIDVAGERMARRALYARPCSVVGGLEHPSS